MERTIHLRDYRKGDEEAILTLVKTVLVGYDLDVDHKITDRDLADIEGCYLRRGGVFRVVEAAGRVVGSYGLYPASAAVCELRKMYLLPEYQGQGIGKEMMEEVLRAAREKGFREIVLETNSVLERAVTLYKKYGFEYYEPEHLSSRCNCAMRLRL